MFRALVLSFCVFALSGCSTLLTKGAFGEGKEPEQGASNSELGHPYSGTRLDASLTYCTVKSQFSPIKTGERFVVGVLTVTSLIDLPLSIIADTLFLPIDLLSEPKKESTMSSLVMYICDDINKSKMN